MIKDTLIREINKLKKQDFSEIDYLSGRKAYLQAISDIFEMLDTLEVEEVDLEKEIERVFDDDFFKDPVFGKLVNRNAGISIAKHFFELGLKAKDWKKERMEECSFRKVGCTMYKDKILECNGACSWVVDYPKWKQLKAQKGE